MTRNTPGSNLVKLLQVNKDIFTIDDLTVLWDIDKDETLRTTVYRYIKKGILYRIHRGLYSKIPLKNLDQFELGCAIMGNYSYISTETILQQNGVISQNVEKCTLVGRESKEITSTSTTFLCRKMSYKYILNRTGIIDSNNTAVASLERAVADMLYYSPKYYFDNENPIDWKKVNEVKGEIGY